MTRRQMIALSPASAVLVMDAARTAAATLAPGQAVPAVPSGPFVLPPLPYAADALEPHIDAQTMTIHHDRHHAAYVTNLNAALANYADLKARSVEDLVAHLDTLPEGMRTAVRNQGGGHLNHTWFWPSLKRGGTAAPAAEFGKAIDTSFGSFAKMKDTLTAATVGVFGSGWGWLSLDREGKLIVERTSNQDSPLSNGRRPLLGIDVWEHAYYLKYQNRRRDYVDAIFNVVDWDVVQSRWREARG